MYAWYLLQKIYISSVIFNKSIYKGLSRQIR